MAAAIDGFNKANSPDEDIEPMSAEDYDDMLARHSDFINQSAAVH